MDGLCMYVVNVWLELGLGERFVLLFVQEFVPLVFYVSMYVCIGV
jgi:hypothetical protein